MTTTQHSAFLLLEISILLALRIIILSLTLFFTRKMFHWTFWLAFPHKISQPFFYFKATSFVNLLLISFKATSLIRSFEGWRQQNPKGKGNKRTLEHENLVSKLLLKCTNTHTPPETCFFNHSSCLACKKLTQGLDYIWSLLSSRVQSCSLWDCCRFKKKKR